MDLKFYGSSACNSGTNIVTTLGSVLDSDHLNENTGPDKVFDTRDNSKWAGMWNNNVDKEFFVGYEFSSPETVLCASFLDDSGKGANTVKIQAYNENSEAWVDFAEIAHTPGDRQNIMLSIQSTPTSSPTTSPMTPSPTTSPTSSPITPPTTSPTSRPTTSPTTSPTSSPTTSSPTGSPTSSPTGIPTGNPTRLTS